MWKALRLSSSAFIFAVVVGYFAGRTLNLRRPNG